MCLDIHIEFQLYTAESACNIQVHHPFGITIRGNEYFWTDWKYEKIQCYDRDTSARHHLKTGLVNEGKMYDIKYAGACPQGNGIV